MAWTVRSALVTAGMLTLPISSAPAWAQPPAAPSGLTVSSPVQGDLVEGRISRVDQRARTITLENGREYLLPPPLNPNWTRIRAGATVRMRYGATDGRNLATQIEVRP